MKCKCIKKRSFTGFLEIGKVYEANVRKVAGMNIYSFCGGRLQLSDETQGMYFERVED